jgi:alkylhydroperoxidase family enzyme
MRPLTKDDVQDPELKAVLEQGEKWLGQPAIGAGIQAYAPTILAASRALGAAPAKSGLLPAELRSLVCLRAAEMVGCAF